MNASPSNSWTELFSAKETTGFQLDLRVINKGGEPWLILPTARSMAVKSLSLYPAQTTRARTAKKILKLALSLGLPLPLKRTRVKVASDDPFARFLIQLSGRKSGAFPPLGILAGNPRAEGRRFLVLLFDEQGQPAFVVKAGIGAAARRLIQAETAFFQGVASDFTGLPKFCGSLVSGRVEALALAYVEGESPTSEDRPLLAKLFSSWLDRSRTISLKDVPAWQALERALRDNPAGLGQRADQLANFTFHPTLFHGDFAPWNIKVSKADGTWTVLDWERGERIGFPGWDWFHYVIQTEILVEKLTAEASLQRLENLLADTCFQAYAKLAGIQGREKILVMAYLSHCIHVIRPGEGLETTQALLALLSDRF